MPRHVARPARSPVAVVVSLHAAGAGLRKERAPALVVRAGHGAVGDRHAGRDPDRALLVTSLTTYAHLSDRGIGLAPGALGENLVLDGIVPESLARGTRLRAGDALLELAAPCTVCAGLSVLDPRLPKAAYGRRGVYARVIDGGVVAEGDRVDVLPRRGRAATDEDRAAHADRRP